MLSGTVCYTSQCLKERLIFRRQRSNHSKLSQKCKVVTNCFVFYYLSIFTNTVYMNCFVRDFISCWWENKEVACVCTCYIYYGNNHITLCNNCLFFVAKIRKSNTIIFYSIYKLLRSSKLSSNWIYLRFMIKILWTYELRNIAYVSCIKSFNNLSGNLNIVFFSCFCTLS